MGFYYCLNIHDSFVLNITMLTDFTGSDPISGTECSGINLWDGTGGTLQCK